MPPRYAYWTILVDDQPTAFRASAQEDLMPTLKRLQAMHASAKMMWWQNGKLWNSRHEAQDAMHMRGEMGRRGDARQRGGGFRDRNRSPEKLQWTPKDQKSEAESRGPRRSAQREGGLDWKPKGEFIPAPKRADRPERSEWKPKFQKSDAGGGGPRRSARSAKAGPQDLKTSRPSARPEWKPKFQKSEADGRGPRRSAEREGGRKWIPKEEYKARNPKPAPRDKNWRPGGEHKDPRQKYKDAKKAKWSRFKQNIRTRWESKNKKNDE